MKKGSPGTPPEISYHFTTADLKTLLAPRQVPCVSIYFPAHRRRTEARADCILYRNLCREVENVLQQDSAVAVTRAIVGRLDALDVPEFCEHGSEGVAVFAAQDFAACFRLPLEVPTLEVVGGSFHTKPLLRYLQEGLSYHVLALSLHRVALYDGWGDGLQKVDLHGVPASLEEALGIEIIPGYRGAHPRGENRLHHVQGSGGGDAKVGVEKYFREVARGLGKNGLKDAQKPLILAAQRQHQPIFRRVAQLPTLLDEGIHADAGKMTPEAIRSEARRILRPRFRDHVARAKEDYGLAVSRGQGSERLQEVARAAVAGRVRRLFVESGRRIWGLLDRATGDLIPGDSHKNAHDTDLLDDLAELTISYGGGVLVLSADDMPSRMGLAATYRF